MQSGWETHKGKKIFCARYQNMNLDQLQKEIEEVKAYMSQGADQSEFLVLVDTTGTLVSPGVLAQFKDISSKSTQFKTKTAILGMTGPRRTFLDIVSKFSKVTVMPFDDSEKAKDWLVA